MNGANRKAVAILKTLVMVAFASLVQGCAIFNLNQAEKYPNAEVRTSVTDSGGKAVFFSEALRSDVTVCANSDRGGPISNLHVTYVASAEHVAIFINDAGNAYLPGIYFGPATDLLNPKRVTLTGLETGVGIGVGIVLSVGVIQFVLSQVSTRGLIQVSQASTGLLSAVSSFLSSVAGVIGERTIGTLSTLIGSTYGTFGLRQTIIKFGIPSGAELYYILRPDSHEYMREKLKDDILTELLTKGYQLLFCDELEFVKYPVVGFVDVKIKNQCPRIVIKATPLEGEAPLTVKFDATESYDPDGRIVAFEWEFGDGNRGTGPVISHTYKIPNTYTVTLKVKDEKGAVNHQSVVIRVKPRQCPDLSVEGIRLDPAQFSPGQRVSVVFKVRNTGTTSSPAFRVAIMMDEKLLESHTVNKLDAGQEIAMRSSSFVWPDASCHLVGIVLDSDNTVNECDEQNNQMSARFCPTQQCVNRPSIWTDKNEYCLGEQVNIFIRVSAPSRVDLWVINPYGQAKYLLENYYLEDSARQYTIKVKAGEPTGERTLYLRSRACGNEVTVSWAVRVKHCADSPIGLPDLIVENVELIKTDLSKCPDHLGVTLRITVSNVGRALANPFEVSVCLKSCPMFCCIPCETRTIGPLGAGERKTFTVFFSIPVMCFLWGADPPMNPPPAIIRVTADSTEQIIEQQEHNNQKEISIPYICPN